MKNFKNFGSKILFFAIFFVFEAFSQNLLFRLDLTDTTKLTFGDYTYDKERKVTEIQGSGSYNPVYEQTDTAKQPVWREGEGVFFKRYNSNYLTIKSGQKNFPSTATFIIVARHLGRNPTSYGACIIGDTSSFLGYNNTDYDLVINSNGGNYIDNIKPIKDYGGLKTILSFRVKSNTIDTLFINGYTLTGSVTLGDNIKGGILGGFFDGTAYGVFWSGYIYEILVYDQALTNKQLDSLHQILSDKHHIGYKIISPDPVPHSTQPLAGSGTQADPYLIYTAWHLDSLRFIYPKYPDSLVYVKLMNDIDLSNHPNLRIDSLAIVLDGNHKTLKNLARDSSSDGRFVLFRTLSTQILNVKNLTLENFTIFPIYGKTDITYISFLYLQNPYVNADSIIFKKCFINAHVLVYDEVRPSIINRYMNSMRRIGFESCEIIMDVSRNEKIFQVNNLNEVYFDKNTVLGIYFRGSSVNPPTIFYSLNSNFKDIYFRNKSFISHYNYYEYQYSLSRAASGNFVDVFNTVGVYQSFNNIYFTTNIIYTSYQRNKMCLSYGFSNNPNKNLSTSYIDTTYRRNFLAYPDDPFSGQYPQVKTTAEMKLQSTYVGFDFDSVWAINPTMNDGYPYFQFLPPSTILNVLYPNDSTITKLTKDTLNIKLQSSLDTTSVYLVNINNNDTIYIGKTSSDSIITTFPPKMQGQFKVLITSTDKQEYFLAPNYFTVIRDTNLIIYEPYFYQTVYKGDSLSVIYSQDIDTAKFYIRKDRYSNWEYKGFDVVTDTLDTFKIYISYDYSDDAQVLVTNFDSTVTGISDVFIILSNRYIEIVEPTPDSMTIYSNGLLVKVKSKNVPDYDVYVKIDSNYYYYTNITTANSGNEDYTSFVLDYKRYLLSGKITIVARKGDIGEIKGSMDTAYYKQNQFTYAGMRSPYPQFQSRTNFSNLYELSGNIYSICYYAFPYGWYDWHDRVEIYKYNPTSQFFNMIAKRGFPSSAPYPDLLFYRTGTYSAALVYGSNYYRTINYYLMPDTIYQISPFISISLQNPVPINLDANRTTEVVANLWKYRIEGTKIYAYDLKNAGNNLMLADLTTISNSMTGITPNAFQLFAGAGKLFITNHCYTDPFARSDTYFINLFSENEVLTNDEVTVEIKTAKRNFFRGIYPKAIIKVIPRL